MGDPYRLTTPEQVELEYDLAGLGSRFVAALIDVSLQGTLWFMLLIAAVGGAALLSRAVEEDTLVFGVELRALVSVIGAALFILLSFILLWGYYVFFEMVWNGQSPGKRVMGLRVVRSNGQPITFFESLVRNVVRVADFLPSAYILGVVTMLLNDRSRRLGDFAAGTMVVKERRDVSLASLRVATPGAAAAQPDPAASAAAPALNWAALQASDYVLVREFLMRRGSLAAERRAELGLRIASGLAAKLGQPVPGGAEAEAFLGRLAAEYRRR